MLHLELAGSRVLPVLACLGMMGCMFDGAPNVVRPPVSLARLVAAGSSTRLVGGEKGNGFGAAVAIPGDIDGDGYADVVVGAPGTDGESPGEVYVFYGAAAGVGTVAQTVLTGSTAAGGLGATVGPLGDVNADGFADVAIGTSDGLGVYLGSVAGLQTEPSLLLPGVPAEDVAHGDFDCDGFTDLAVVDGAALVMRAGSDAGPSPLPGLRVDLREYTDSGWTVVLHASGVGDVDGDGCDEALVDVVSSGPWGPPGPIHEGLVFSGGPSGLNGDLLLEMGNEWVPGGVLGYLRASGMAGDLDGDGRMELWAMWVGLQSSQAQKQHTVRVYDLQGADFEETLMYSITSDWDGGVVRVDPVVQAVGDLNADGFDDLYVDSQIFGGATAIREMTGAPASTSIQGRGGRVNTDCADDVLSPTGGESVDVVYGIAYDDGLGGFIDLDGDGYGTAKRTCDRPYVEDATDCNDIDPTVHPGAMELCDGLDQDCDGEVDEEVCGDTGETGHAPRHTNAPSTTVPGCGCATGAGPGASALVMLLAVRRRRSASRG